MPQKSDNSLIYIGGLSALLLIFLSTGREKTTPQGRIYTEKEFPHKRTRDILNNLHPAIRSKVVSMLIAARNIGIPLILTSGLRDFDEQQALYDQGRTKPGQIVTNAKPGDSFHNYGLAFDTIPDVKDWKTYPRWHEIGAIGKQLGFKWLALEKDGGSSKSLDDKVHFEYRGATIAQLKQLWQAGQHDGNYVRLAE